jgi:hypothetical protein
MSEVVTEIRGFDGEPKQWRVLSARLRSFWKAHPPEEGWALKTEATDYLSTKPQLATLYNTVLAAGSTPEEKGLPSLEHAAKTVVMRTLLTHNGQVVASASSLKPIGFFSTRDWEKAETASVNRLLARIGLGGEVLDRDEAEDIAEAVGEAHPAESAGAKSTDSGETEKPEKARASTKSAGKTGGQAPPGGKKKAKADAEARKLASLQGMVKTMAENLGEEPGPVPSTVAEATARIKELRALTT